MYINTKRPISTFGVKLESDGGEVITVNILPPKVSFYDKIENIKGSDGYRNLAPVLLEILNRNKEKTEITKEFFEDAVDLISFNFLFEDIMNWIAGIANDPN